MNGPLKTTLIIYAKNEIDGMRIIMPQIKKEWCDEIIVIDGNSTDGTYEFCIENGYKVYKQTEVFWGGAYKAGHEHATGDIIIDFSPDGNSKPEAIPLLIDKINEGYDMVVASRYADGAKSEDDSFVTGFGNALFTGLVNFLFRAKYTDVLVIYRAYRKEILKKTRLDRELDHAFTTQVCIRCARSGLKVADIGVDEPKRVGGIQKMNPLRDGFLDLILIIREFLFYWPAK